jgi:hypothetical protein
MRVAFLTVAVWTLAFMMAAGQPSSRPLTIEQYKTAGVNIAITSTSFAGNGTIPTKHADYGEKISPALSWTVPPSAKSLVVIVEDPDAKEPKPFVHWVLYNLPPSFAALPEAVPGAPRLPEFGGALQGRNSRGTIGYWTPSAEGRSGPSLSLPSLRGRRHAGTGPGRHRVSGSCCDEQACGRSRRAGRTLPGSVIVCEATLSHRSTAYVERCQGREAICLGTRQRRSCIRCVIG